MLLSDRIFYLVIHCSDSQDDKNYNAKNIHALHLKFGWDGIGYHKVICRSGLIENGRPEYWIGAHAQGFNDKSLGVCLIGRNKFTENQFSSLKKVIQDWKIKYPKAEIVGHNQITKSNKTCPNFNVKEWCQINGFNT